MRKNILIFFAFFMVICCLAQDEKFGHNYLNWVHNEASNKSREVTTNELELRLNHIYHTTYAKGYQTLFEIDSLLNILNTRFENQKQKIDELTEDFSKTYLQNYYASNNHHLIFDIESKIAFLKKDVLELDSIGTRRVFYQNGLHNIGTSHLLESFSQVGNNMSDYLPEKYPFSIGFTYSSHPSAEDFNSPQTQGQWTGMLTTLGGAIGSLASPLGAAIGASIGAIIGGFLDYEETKKKQRKAQKKYEEQLKKVEEANKLLPDKLLTISEQYKIYQSFDSVLKIDYKEVKKNFYSHLVPIEELYIELSNINLLNKKYAKEKLKQENLGALIEFYGSDQLKEELQGYKEAISLLQIFDKDLNYVRRKVQALSNTSVIKEKENLSDLIKTNISYVNFLLNDYKYPLVEKELRAYKKSYQKELRALAPNSSFITPTTYIRSNYESVIVLPSFHAFEYTSPQTFYVSEEAFAYDDSGLAVVYENGEYALIVGGKSYVNDRMQNGGANKYSDILGSSYDGGYREYAAKAASTITRCQNDINERIGNMVKEKTKLFPVLKEWRNTTLEMYTTPIVTTSELSAAGNQLSAIETVFIENLDNLSGLISQLTSPSNLNSNYIERQQQIDLISEFTEREPAVLVSDVSSPLFEGLESVVSKEEYLRTATGKSIKEATQRVAQGTHAFINSEEELAAAIKTTENLSTFINTLLSEGYTEEVVNKYLDLLGEYNLYFKGLSNNLTNENSAFNTGNEATFRTLKSSLKTCVASRGIANCETIHQALVSSITQEKSGAAMSEVSKDLDDQTINYISNNSVANNVFYIFDNSETEASHYAIVLPGFYQTTSDIMVSYIDAKNPENSVFRGKLTDVFPDLSNVAIYQQEHQRYYGNSTVNSYTSSLYKHQCYHEEVGYYDCSNIELSLEVKNNESRLLFREEAIDLNSNFVEGISSQYGRNSQLFFKEVHKNLNTYFNPGNIPEEKKTDQYRGILKKVADFDQSYSVETQPQQLYNSIAMHNLLTITNEAINSSSDMTEIQQITVESAQYLQMLLDIGTAVTPVVNDARDIYELLTGLDLITHEEIGVFGRSLAAGGLIIGSGALFRKILDSVSSTATTKVLQNIARKGGVDRLTLIKTGEFAGSSKTKNGLIFRKKTGDLENRYLHILKNHHKWGKIGAKSRFGIAPREMIKRIDLGYSYVKNNEPGRILKQSVTDNGNRKYVIQMDESLYEGSKIKKKLVLILDPRTDVDLIVTAYPEK